jgi:hypothetical protein
MAKRKSNIRQIFSCKTRKEKRKKYREKRMREKEEIRIERKKLKRRGFILN